MKRYGNLYPQVCSWDNIVLAHKKAQKRKQHYAEIQRINRNEDVYLQHLHKMLQTKSYQTSPYTVETRNDTGKEREIYILPYYPDRVVHHCIMNVMEPIWQRCLIRDTYSAVKGRGIHDGWKRMNTFLKDKQGTKYCLKVDIKKFYPSISHHVLEEILALKIKCKDLLNMLFEIIRSAPGLPIGNYLSQYLGNLTLSPLDNFMKHTMKVRYYSRYCDDIVILGSSKNWLREVWAGMEWFLADNLQLELKNNCQIFPVRVRGIDYLGYRFFADYTLARKSIAKKFKRAMRQVEKGQGKNHLSRVMSYRGWLQYAQARRLWKSAVGSRVRQRVADECDALQINNPLIRLA